MSNLPAMLQYHQHLKLKDACLCTWILSQLVIGKYFLRISTGMFIVSIYLNYHLISTLVQ